MMTPTEKPRDIQIIFAGTSAGGVSAIQALLTALPANFPIPLVFVQHLPADSVIDPQLIFGRAYKGRISEVIDKMPIERCHAYFAPPGYHLSVERDFSLSLSQEDPVNFARPSIDLFFESVAAHVGKRACAVLMTGANSDGALGLKSIQEHGGYTLVQDPESAEAPMMPKSALAIMKPDTVGSIETIARTLTALAERESK